MLSVATLVDMQIGTRQSAAKPKDNARLWRTDAFGGLELLRAHYSTFHFAPHAHDEFMIVVTEEGTGQPRFWGAEQRVGPGDVFVLGPGEVHSGGPARESTWCYRSLYLPATCMARIVEEISGVERGTPLFVEQVVNDHATASILKLAHVALEEPGSTLAREATLLEALALLVARYTTRRLSERRIGREPRSVRRAKEYLEAFPGENVSLEALARVAGIGPFHLCRVFRQETGLSPHAYQILMRLRLAKTLLRQGVPIAQVAVDAGFADQAHLTRHFKRIFGVTPGRYARQAD